MKNLFMPLDEQEMDRLDACLLDRLPDMADLKDLDEGILSTSMLDGFMSAIISGPGFIPPSIWLAAVWGNFEPEWESQEMFEETFSLMIRHMNGIAATLNEEPETFEPLFMERVVGGQTFQIVDQWCDGYLRGMGLAAEGWHSAPNHIQELLGFLPLFSSPEGWERQKQMRYDEVEQLQQLIAPTVRRIHAYWYERRCNEQALRRNTPKTGRNDPCPCGSGKKFKKCCGEPPTVH